jgi:hypothetical protein
MFRATLVAMIIIAVSSIIFAQTSLISRRSAAIHDEAIMDECAFVTTVSYPIIMYVHPRIEAVSPIISAYKPTSVSAGF